MTLLAAAFIVVRFREANRDRRVVFTIPALYGMYDVEAFARDSVPVPPGDSTRWLRLVIAERGTAAIQWTTGGRVDPYSLKEDPKESVLTLTGRGSKPAVHTLRYTRETDDRLAVVGTVDGHLIQAQLRAMDLTKFPLRRPRR